jgi:hypothetical protein
MKRKLIVAALAASLVTALAPMDAHAVVKRIIHKKIHKPKAHFGHGNNGAWIVGGIVCAASGPILTTLILNRQLTRDEAIGSMFFCFPPGLYGLMLRNQQVF